MATCNVALTHGAGYEIPDGYVSGFALAVLKRKFAPLSLTTVFEGSGKVPTADGAICTSCEAELNHRRWLFDVE